jgi:CHAT domain-containing protein/tetratricopeptide (TPR) repeat protein
MAIMRLPRTLRTGLLPLIVTVVLQIAWAVAPARAQADDPLALLNQIIELTKSGQFDEAIKLENRLIGVLEKAVGKKHPLYLAQIASLGELYGMKRDFAEARRIHLNALKLREASLGAEHPDVASSLASLATVDISLARYDEAETGLRRALRIREKALPKSSPDYGFTFVNLGRLYMMRSRFADADRLFQQALDLFRQHLPPDHIYLPVTINNLAEAKRALGRFTEAEAMLRQALEMSERLHGTGSFQTAAMINNLAQLYRQYGRFAEAEALMRRELAITEKLIGPSNPGLSVSLNNLGTLLVARGRAEDGETLIRRALVIEEHAGRGDHPDVATTLNNLADAVSFLGKSAEAEQLFRRSLAIRERLYGANALPVANALDNLSAHLFSLDRLEEAVALSRRALAIRTEHQPADHPDLALSLTNLATLLDTRGEHDEAKGLHERAIAIRTAALGVNHPDLALSITNFAGNQLDRGDGQGAYDSYRRGTAIRVGRRGSGEVAGDANVEVKRFVDSFLGFTVAAFELARTADEGRRAALSEEAFEALQWASLSEAAAAIAQMSARVAAGSGALADLVRERQDLATELKALDKSLLGATGSAPEARSKLGETALRERSAAVGARLQALDDELRARFPEFAAIADPEPKALSVIRKALRPDEALYTMILTRKAAYAWLVTADGERWVRIDRASRVIRDDVAALRCGLDAAAWAQPKSRCPELTGQRYSDADLARGKLPPFDLKRSHNLYRALFGQVEDLIEGRKLIIMPTGPLTRLPFQVLVTQEPGAGKSEAESYRSAAWLARRTSITVLPSIGALQALRANHQRSTATEPYFGFGNPLLDGPDRRYASLAKFAKDQQSCAVPWKAEITVAARAMRSLAGPMLTAGNVVDAGFLRRQVPLPETAYELCTVAVGLGAGDRAVQLGTNASESAIKRLNERGALRNVRVLHFATHGAMAGEIVGSGEPGLILTPPAVPSAADDGYLSASEIALLKLDADLVILSACNTAAGGEGSADETLSGLARSFFYAGARTLLVSHWAIDSAATVKLVTKALAERGKGGAVDYSQALQASMRALIDKGDPAEAHPSYWAPFVVVGGAGDH